MSLDKRKYHMAQISAAQYAIEFHKEAVAEIDGGGEVADLADAPANSGAARQAAERTGAGKAGAAKGKKAPAVEVEDEPSLSVEDETDGGEGLALDAEEDAGSDITEKEVIAAIRKLADAKGKNYVAALLKKFKAKAIQDLKEKDYADVMATIEATLKPAAKNKK